MEWGTTGTYRVASLTPDTFPGALDVIRRAFCQDEAVSIAAEVNTNPEAIEELLELCADAALDGVSLVALDPAGTVVAAAFNKLQVPPCDPTEKPFFATFADERCKNESSRSLVRFMLDVDERCNLFEKYGADCSLELMFVATLREHRRRGLGSALCRHSIELANKLKDGPVSEIRLADLGAGYAHMRAREPPRVHPKICQAIWTGKASQSVGNALGFHVEVTVPYDEFVHN